MFTSRLPTLSVRRPVGRSDATSTSFSSRPTSIPVTVKKANLFTPQTKRQPLYGGASTAGKSGMTTDRKYQTTSKPMPDRDQQLKMFNDVFDYIKQVAPQFPIPVPKKFFSSMSTTETCRIFEFLLGRLLNDFKIAKLEKDVPDALALLGYPYMRSVTKSALVSVTTRQASVGLLIIFNWLITAINDFEDAPEDEFDDCNDIRTIVGKAIVFHPHEADKIIKDQLERIYPWEDVAGIDQQISEIFKELDIANQELDEFDEQQQENINLDEDIVKCHEYEAQMQDYVGAQEKAEADAERQLEETRERMESLRAERDDGFHELCIEEPDMKMDLEKGPEILRHQNEISTLEKTIDRIKKNSLARVSSHEETKINLAAQREEYTRQLATLATEHKRWMDALTNKYDQKREVLRSDQERFATSIEENHRYLECALQLRLQQVEATVKDAESEAKKWRERLTTAENDNRDVKLAMKLF